MTPRPCSVQPIEGKRERCRALSQAASRNFFSQHPRCLIQDEGDVGQQIDFRTKIRDVVQPPCPQMSSDRVEHALGFLDDLQTASNDDFPACGTLDCFSGSVM
jgi:hypothetical protein